MILVTGSSGRIGRAVVQALIGAGRRVRGLDLAPSALIDPLYDEVTGSLDDTTVVAHAMAGVHEVLHLGALMSWDARDRDAMFRTNVDGTRHLLDAAAAAGLVRFVLASSGEVYPEGAPQQLPVKEDHPLCPTSAYGLTKLLCEEMVQFHQRQGRIDTVILRFSHTQDAKEMLDEQSFFSGPRFFLGPRIRQQDSLGNSAVANLLRAVDPGCPAHVLARNAAGRPYRMHITETRDMVQGILLGLNHPAAAGGIFNLGATEPVDFADILPRMAAITGYPVVTVDLPGQGVYYCTSNSRIRETLGFEPQWTINRILNEAAQARWERAQA